MSPFTITTTSESVKVQNGRGEASITVTNITDRPVKARVEILPDKPEASKWLSVRKDPERVIDPGVTAQLVIQLNVPAGSPEGDYTFRVRASDLADPNERVTTGPVLGFKIAATPQEKKPFPWWIPVVAGVVVLLLIGGGITIWLLNRGDGDVAEIEVPDVTNKTIAEAKTSLEEAGFVVGEITRKVEAKPPDIVLEQKPAPKESAAKGDTVTLVATDPTLVLVPPLKGKLENQAQASLAGLLDIDRVEKNCVNEAGPVNSIYETSPRTGDAVARTTKLLLRVKDDCVKVPRIKGSDKGTAFASLNAVGLLGNPVSGTVDLSRVNIVEDTTPREDDLLPKGSTVTVKFYRGRVILDPRIFDDVLIRQKQVIGRIQQP